MKQYQEMEDGSYCVAGMTIPATPANRHHQQMTKEVADSEAEILPYVPPVKTVDELRAAEYQALGVTTDAMVVAMWEKVVEGRSDVETGVADLQIIRDGVKAANPKV